MSDVRYINNLKVGGMTEENDELVSFEGIASTDSLNTYFYRMHISSLRNFRDDAIDGRPVYPMHRKGELNLGNTFGASLYDKKVKMQWNILRGLEDVNSDDIIKRLISGVTGELSVGHDFAEYICDVDGTPMILRKNDFIPTSATGLHPGQIIRKNGKNITVTAKAHNARLRELSIVGRGADPDTKIIGMLKQELASDNMNAQGLAFLSEFYNLNYSSFFNQLGYNGYQPKQYSIPTRNKSMAANPDLLAKTNEELQTKNEELQTRVDELEADIQKLPTEEEYANLQKDMAALQSELDSADLAELKQLAAQGQAYLDIVRDEAKTAFRTKLMSDGVKKVDVEEHPEYLAHCRDVDEIDDIKTLYRVAQSNYRSARSNRNAGRVSKELNDYTSKVEGDKTRFVGGANDVR